MSMNVQSDNQFLILNSISRQTTAVVIEDMPTVGNLAAILLTRMGFKVISFETGESACTWFESNSADIILCDIMLPEMSGEEVLERLRQLPHLRDVPIIAVTALALGRDRERLLGLGFTDYIAKPVSSATFIQHVKSLLVQNA